PRRWHKGGVPLLYLLLKWLHVLLAIVAVGTNMTYGIWLARAGRDPQHLLFALRGVKVLDDRVANPAYGFLLITGVALVYVSGLSFTTPWVLAALVLYALLFLLGLFGYTPTLKRQIAAAESGGAGSSEYQALARRATMIGIMLAVV